jgi:uncharacterized membrane protein YqhA
MPSESRGEEASPESSANERPSDLRLERILAGSLRLAYIPIVVLLLAALGAFVYGTFYFIHSVRQIADHPIPVGHQIGEFLLDVDLFLIGATLLISAVGLYELFVREIQFGKETQIPSWLEMRDLNDLKGRIIAMIVLVLSVSFAEVVVDMYSGRHALELGGGIALVIAALTFFVRFGGHGSAGNNRTPGPQ